MGKGNEERGYSEMKSLIKGYGREKRLGTTGIAGWHAACILHVLDSNLMQSD
jgi:hypothetical protein